MGDRTAISWADATWNPVAGCSRVSPGCDNCYAEKMAVRIQASGAEAYDGVVDRDGNWTGRINQSSERTRTLPWTWRKPRRIFVGSMTDMFHPTVPRDEIIEVFFAAVNNPHHQFLLLTKRAQRMAEILGDPRFRYEVKKRCGYLPLELAPWEWPLPNVWAGVSIEHQAYAFRARHLAETPAAVRWVSAEPLLGPVELDLEPIDWLVVGGESGPGARPMDPAWARSLRDQAADADTALYFKQWGSWTPSSGLEVGRTGPSQMMPSGQLMVRNRRTVEGDLDGVAHHDYPNLPKADADAGGVS